MRTISVDTTKRGIPAVWESGGGLTSGGSATIIAKPDGTKPRAVYVRRGGHLACENHALVAIHEGCYIVYAGVSRGTRSSASISRIVSVSVKDIDGEKWEATAEVETVNTFSRGEWDKPLDQKFAPAVEAAFGKASTYHNRSAWYVDTSERIETDEQRKRREAEMVKQDAERARLRTLKATADAKAKAEAEAASREAKASGLGARLEAAQVRLDALRSSDPSTSYNKLELGETYFVFGWGDKLYTETNVVEVERNVVYWENQVVEKLRKQTARTEFQPQFETFVSRVEVLGLSLKFGDECASWSDGYYGSGFDYTATGLESFKADLIHKEEEAAKKAREEALAKAKALAEVEAEALGLPQNIRIWKRTGSATGCGMGWVITLDGFDRERDCLENDNPRRAARYDEGYLVWKQILPGELVLRWSKAYTAASHEFEVIHLPSEGLTEAQLERVAEIQKELEDEWVGRYGLASGLPSPTVGDGWGLLPKFPSKPIVLSADKTKPLVGESLNSAIDALRGKFGSK